LVLSFQFFIDFESFEVVTTSKPGAFPSALRNKRDDVQSEIKDATAALVSGGRREKKLDRCHGETVRR